MKVFFNSGLIIDDFKVEGKVPVVMEIFTIDHARLKVASAPRSGDWLCMLPIASLELKLTDDEGMISVALRLGIRPCSPHNCVCRKFVDAIGLHGLSCRRSTHKTSTPRHVERHQLEVNQKSANSGT